LWAGEEKESDSNLKNERKCINEESPSKANRASDGHVTRTNCRCDRQPKMSRNSVNI
jgi:hypothetical protein